MAVIVDESPDITNEHELMACIKIDDVVVVKCTTYLIDQLTNVYTDVDVAQFETVILDHVENKMGYEMIPQLENDIKDAIAYLGTLG